MHPGYGQVSICKTGRQLQMVINDNLSLPLEHAHADVFEAWYEIIDQRQEVIFFTDRNGDIEGRAVQMEPKVKAINLGRVPAS